MLLRCLLVLIRNDKVVNNALYSRCFLVQIALVLLDTLFAAEVDATVSQILLLAIDGSAHWNPLHVHNHIVRHTLFTGTNWFFWTRALWFVADKAKCINLNLLTFNQSCGALNDELEDRSIFLECFLKFFSVFIPLSVLSHKQVLGCNCSIVAGTGISHRTLLYHDSRTHFRSPPSSELLYE